MRPSQARCMRKDFSLRQTPSVRRAWVYLIGANVRSLHPRNRLFDVSLLNRPGAELGDRQKIAVRGLIVNDPIVNIAVAGEPDNYVPSSPEFAVNRFK